MYLICVLPKQSWNTIEDSIFTSEEKISVEFVTNKSWSGYNYYKGNFESVVQINTDHPITIDRALILSAHEAYPGHHIQNIFREMIYKNYGWLEFSVYPFSVQMDPSMKEVQMQELIYVSLIEFTMKR